MSRETDGSPDVRVPENPSRRDFVALSTAAGVAAATGARAAELAVVEKDVTIKTADGICDAVFVCPKTGTYPGVLVWPDVFGLRPTLRDLGKRLAGSGYAVLVPNLFYRLQKAPLFDDISKFDFSNPADRARLDPLIGAFIAPGSVESDAKAYIAFLDAQHAVNKSKKVGTQGYCMGGPLAVRTAAAVPDRVGAVASFHGGGLVTDKPDSPHLLAPKLKAHVYIAIAASDDARDPDAKTKLKEAFDAAHVTAEVEVYPGTQHGWCMPDMPVQKGNPIYSKPDAERAWSKLLALYKSALA